MKNNIVILLSFACTILLIGCHKHDFQNATCTAPRTCNTCGYADGEPLGHDYTEPTCTESSTCSRCNELISGKLGHDFSEPTCTEPATCSRCGTTTGDTVGHHVPNGEIVLEPTCTTYGEMIGKCTHCGSLISVPTAKASHVIADGEIVIEPTCVEIGLQEGICQVCGEVGYAKIPCLEPTVGDQDIQDTSSHEATWEDIINKYPHSTYEEIESGTYSNQYVILSCVIESAEYSDLMDWVRCDVWFVYKDIYKLNDILLKCDNLKDYNPKALQPGDNIDICVYVNIDNSFGNDIISFTQNNNTLTLSEIHDCVPVNFTYCGNVRNDVTGNWRLSKASTNLHSSEYILFYYKNFFKSDNEIHAIINFTDNTTIRIKPILGMLDVSVFSHIDGEENDAKILFGGKLIETYQVNIDTGEIIYLSE